jgi:dihydroorotase
MTLPYQLVVTGGTLCTPGGPMVADLGIREGQIVAIGDLGAHATAAEVIDARGLHVLPGVIDAQVHFREPGFPHKEDLATGTAAAVLGGVTAVLEMPNTEPPTTTALALADKVARLAGRARCDVGFFVGATPDNAASLGQLEGLPGCAGVKVFMGSSTGSLLVADDEALSAVFASGRRRIAVHAEDEARLRERKAIAVERADVAAHPEWRDAETALRATWRAVALARRFGRPVHVLHVTSRRRVRALGRGQGHRDLRDPAAAPDPGRARLLRRARHPRADEPADPRRPASAPRCGRRHLGRVRSAGHRSRAAHPRGEGPALSGSRRAACPACRRSCRSCSTTSPPVA